MIFVQPHSCRGRDSLGAIRNSFPPFAAPYLGTKLLLETKLPTA